MLRWLILLLLLGVFGIIGAIFLSRAVILAVPEQPIVYDHQVHIQAGVQCLFCHTGATRSPVAGIPSLQKCMGCHNVIATDRPAIQELTGYWERNQPIPWVRVNVQPDFVFFNHQLHLGAALSCETCHGAVSKMRVAEPEEKMDMGWCLNCHLKQPKEKTARLTDCLTCHK